MAREDNLKPETLRWYQAGCCNLRFKHWHDAWGAVSPLDPRVKRKKKHTGVI